ncbi:division/cell wall cluster transcriptional repressor MraZ [candidate division WWE3 bacterium CG09_land_8_20_14_0_10_39_24]|uniref:Transcriptional regulator MraZ n=2 Tax=Katanobacteria TaxID=422282 RepID=A0A2G9XCU3_UNCKA|nr:MAG: division/cell wall cluster transcriptional repressor MraZ [bacterium CG2_30_40_12]OJI09001.1 MAG: division/cell wall cluster transcriptional repressor MraZ [bacterium CG09_39_24]PIP04818.1 MAG: division/cell wall cluster transcriptional repressor MraZ [candidate division WWE3 bacterium CG23_combo_of_CG06-09_8_20_14_all_40_14]PIS12894.1 MAG: division/cell wall cluster transcriptional repressor MraZ [candidate division WWE3 bacterium CG09_land_8_20_14_0_10_39_24]PJE51740.1 MAG: division/c
MLIGEYRNKLDEKNRVALPKKFRAGLGDKVVVARGYEGCLIVVSQKSWKFLIEETVKGPFTSGVLRDTTRFLLGGAFEVELDGQGRFVLPKNLLNYAMLHGEACFVGLGRWVEVWDSAKWDERLKFLYTHGSEIADKLSLLEI